MFVGNSRIGTDMLRNLAVNAIEAFLDSCEVAFLGFSHELVCDNLQILDFAWFSGRLLFKDFVPIAVEGNVIELLSEGRIHLASVWVSALALFPLRHSILKRCQDLASNLGHHQAARLQA